MCHHSRTPECSRKAFLHSLAFKRTPRVGRMKAAWEKRSSPAGDVLLSYALERKHKCMPEADAPLGTEPHPCQRWIMNPQVPSPAPRNVTMAM